MATELYTPDGFAKRIDTYKDLALSASNAIRNKSWDDNVSVASSVATVNNTVDFSGCFVSLRSANWGVNVPLSVAGTFSYVLPAGATVTDMVLWLHTSASLPNSGKYRVQVDFASDSSLEYRDIYNWYSLHSGSQ